MLANVPKQRRLLASVGVVGVVGEVGGFPSPSTRTRVRPSWSMPSRVEAVDGDRFFTDFTYLTDPAGLAYLVG